MKVTFATPFITATTADVFVAEANGYFKKVGVNLTLEVQGATVITTGSAGENTITQSGVTGSFPAAVGGHPTKIVYDMSPGLSVTGIVVAANSPYHSLMDLSGQTVDCLGVGTSTYGAASAYSSYIVKHGGKPLNIVAEASNTTQVAQVVSGQVAASVGFVSIFGPAIKQGKARVLVQPAGTFARSLFPSSIVDIGFWGTASELNTNHVGVTRFIAAVREGDKWLKGKSVKQIATALKSLSYYKTYTLAQVETQVKDQQPFYATKTDGYISKAAWATSLKEYKYFGLKVTVTTPAFSYKNIIDMSYWNKATKLMSVFHG